MSVWVSIIVINRQSNFRSGNPILSIRIQFHFLSTQLSEWSFPPIDGGLTAAVPAAAIIDD